MQVCGATLCASFQIATFQKAVATVYLIAYNKLKLKAEKSVNTQEISSILPTVKIKQNTKTKAKVSNFQPLHLAQESNYSLVTLYQDVLQ